MATSGLDNVIKPYTGTAIQYPLQFSGGRPTYVSGFTNLKQAVKLLLTWEFGDRFYQSGYGNQAYNLLEENTSQQVVAGLKAFIEKALAEWEPRIRVLNVDVRQEKIEKVNIIIEYRFTKANISEVMVVPFYKTIKE